MANPEITKTQMIEMGLPQKIKDKEVLVGLAEIACYLECSISVVRRWIKEKGLPAMALGDQGMPYRTSKFLINRWMAQSHIDRIEKFNWDGQDAKT